MGHYLEGHSTSPRVMIPATFAFHQTARSGAHGFRSHRLCSCCASIVGLGLASPRLLSRRERSAIGQLLIKRDPFGVARHPPYGPLSFSPGEWRRLPPAEPIFSPSSFAV